MPCTCVKCGSERLHKLGEVVSKTLECEPRRWKIIEHVREKFSCRDCEAITEASAPSHPIPRGFAGPNLLAMVLVNKFLLHQLLNRQSKTYAREGIEIDVSTLADRVGNSSGKSLIGQSLPCFATRCSEDLYLYASAFGCGIRGACMRVQSMPSIVINNRRAPGGLFVLHASSLPDNPYDGHTLREVIDRTETLTGPIEQACVEKGYRGHATQNPRRVFISGQKRGVFSFIKRELRRRSAIEPIIGHLKAEGPRPLLS